LLLLLITFSAYKYAETLTPNLTETTVKTNLKSVFKEPFIEENKQNSEEFSTINALTKVASSDDIVVTPSSDSTLIYTRVNEMPLLMSCMKEAEYDRQHCSNGQILKYIYKSIKYPKVAKENNLEGLVVVTFIIDKKGKIGKIKLLRDIGGQCGAETMRVVKKLANDASMKWKAGVHKGEKVNVRINVPIRFKLSKDEKEAEIDKN
ncbi:MAG: TonB family protein, partial [Saprospiraceae bacterium]